MTTTARRSSIFTEYIDTADYVADALRDAGIDNVGLASGDSEDPSDVARRFSPDSNRLPGEPTSTSESSDPIDVLVATDVLSEGQNLQDSHIIVNYDLPWAIIRIIQRAGRVDRVGQESDKVFIYLITHEKVEQQIHLRQRIRRGSAPPLRHSARTSSSSATTMRSRSSTTSTTATCPTRMSDGEGEADAVSEAWLVWRSARTTTPRWRTGCSDAGHDPHHPRPVRP